MDDDGALPTNDVGERTLRPGVMWRRATFGTQSERGNVLAAHIRTVTAICRQQRHVLDDVTRAAQANPRGLAAPSRCRIRQPHPSRLRPDLPQCGTM